MKKIGHIVLSFAIPGLAFAQTVTSVQTGGAVIIDIINNVLVPLIFALAFIVFIWGIFLYFIQGGHDEEKREKGRSLMLWGLIGFFVMVSVWGLVHLLLGTFNLQNTVPAYPTAPYTVNGT